jgi:hypothetical protein
MPWTCFPMKGKTAWLEGTWESGDIDPLILNLGIRAGEQSASYPDHFTSRGISPGTQCSGGWVGPRAGLGILEKRTNSWPFQESNHHFLIIQPVA